MLSTIRAEVRKLISVRSTYVLLAIILAISFLVNFYVEGYWGQSGSAAATLQPGAFNEIVANGVGVAVLFIGIIAILQMGHEYRHNTIAYTLTTNSRRTQVLVAKVIVTGVFSVLVGLLVAVISIGLYQLGVNLRGSSLPPQIFDTTTELLRVTVYSFVYGLAGLFITILFRNLVAAIAFLLIAPATVEPLIGILLKENAVYLPFATFDHVVGASVIQGANLSEGRATILSLIYITIIGIITWLIFLRRDAS